MLGNARENEKRCRLDDDLHTPSGKACESFLNPGRSVERKTVAIYYIKKMLFYFINKHLFSKLNRISTIFQKTVKTGYLNFEVI